MMTGSLMPPLVETNEQAHSFSSRFPICSVSALSWKSDDLQQEERTEGVYDQTSRWWQTDVSCVSHSQRCKFCRPPLSHLCVPSARTQKMPTCRGWTCLWENPLLNAGWRFATGAAVSVYSVGDILLVKAMTGWYRVMTEQQVISTTQISDLYRTFQLSYHKRRIYNF